MNMYDKTIKELAEEFAGNWKEFDSFAWFDKKEYSNPELWGMYYTQNRDSRLMEQSNHQAIIKLMDVHINRGNAIVEVHSHWAYGWIEGLVIRVYTTRGKITRSFKEFLKIMQNLEDYPVLDEDDYCEREYEATLWGIEDQLKYVLNKDEFEELEFSNMLLSEVTQYFYSVEQDEIESRDDLGGYPSEESMVRALESVNAERLNAEEKLVRMKELENQMQLDI